MPGGLFCTQKIKPVYPGDSAVCLGWQLSYSPTKRFSVSKKKVCSSFLRRQRQVVKAEGASNGSKKATPVDCK